MSIYSTLKIFDLKRKVHLEFIRNEYLQKCVNGKHVLHIGCSDFPITRERIEQGNLLHLRLLHSAKQIIGIDLSEKGIDILKKVGVENVFVMDAEEIKFTSKFDVILAGDILEHLNNPGKFLKKASRLLNPEGELIIGVPSALTINNIKAWFGGREQVHSDHTFYFSPKTLSTLCGRYDFLPVKLVFTVQPPGLYESSLFVFCRKMTISLFPSMAPSFIMHFKLSEQVDNSTYLEWK